MWKTLNWVGKNLTITIPLLMLAGFFYGISWQAASLKALIVPMTFLMVYPMMINLNIAKVFNWQGTKLQLTTQFINFAVIPFLAFGLGNVFFANQPYLAMGLLLAALLPTSGMTISWTGFSKGNIEAAIKMTVVGLTLGSLVSPVYIQGLMGESVSIDLASVFKQIGLIVFLPMALGYLTRMRMLKRMSPIEFKQKWASKFSSISAVGVLAIVFVAMALKAKAIAADPMVLLNLLTPLAILYGVNFALSTIVGKLFFKRADAIALVYGTVMRNLSIALAIAINVFGESGSQIALVIAAAYIIQVQAGAWYVKFADKFFGPPDEPTGKQQPPSQAQNKEEKQEPQLAKVF